MDFYENVASHQDSTSISQPREQQSETSTPSFLPDFIMSDPITPNDGVPLQEADQPVVHPLTKQQLFSVLFEDMFGKRKRNSAVWKEYKFYKDAQGKLFAICCHCKDAVYQAEARNGTSNAKRHIDVCEQLKKKIVPPTSNKVQQFDQKVFCELLAEAIMMHGYSFSIVEHKGMRRVFKYLNEDVQNVSRNTIKKVCISKHLEFKEVLKEMFAKLPGKVSLTCDIWTACTSRSYLTLTVHYVDDGWTLRSKVLNFFHFAPPHTGYEIYKVLYDKIREWGLTDKILTTTCDNASNMDSMIGQLKSTLLENLACDGKFFHVRRAAHILNLVVKEGLDVIKECVRKVRETVRYIDASEGRIIAFYECARQCGLVCNTKLWLDVSTRWNSTYLILKKAIYYKRGIDLYASQEASFQHSLTLQEWMKVEKICDLLEPFYEITTLFSGSDYPTSNLYFYNIWDIECLLLLAKDDVDPDIRAMATKMHVKFDKYWHDYSLVMCFGVILDPRYKFDFVKFALKELHGDECGTRLAGEVYIQFQELFKEYQRKHRHRRSSSGASTAPTSISSYVDSNSNSNSISRDKRNRIEAFDATYGALGKDGESEFEFYFRDDKEPRKTALDVLGYWGKKAENFPVLSCMARDVLAIPITSVASESTFSMGGRILSKWRSSLLSKNVEALVTTRNWLFGYEDLEKLGVVVDGADSDD